MKTIKEKLENMELKVIEGGKVEREALDTTTPIDNWLTKLPEGAIFLVQEKNNPMDYVAQEFEILTKYYKGDICVAIDVEVTTPTGSLEVTVIPNRFVNKYTKIKDITETRE